MFKEFTLRIILENAQMQSSEELAEAVHDVGRRIESRGVADDGARGTVFDINGQSVGSWQIRRQGVKAMSADYDRIRRTVEPKNAMDALVKLAAYVGANEWNGDLCEGVIDLINQGLAGSVVQPAQRVGVGDIAVDELWGPIAVELGYSHDMYEEPDEDDDADDGAATGEEGEGETDG
jgi:hypothetical protein